MKLAIKSICSTLVLIVPLTYIPRSCYSTEMTDMGRPR